MSSIGSVSRKLWSAFRLAVVAALFLVLPMGCSLTRHVPDGSYLLDRVEVVVDDSSMVESGELINYLRQTPNHKALGFMRLQLGMYNLSGTDSTRWYNRWLRRLGQPPVIYDDELARSSVRQLRQSLINRGYMAASVDYDTIVSGRKMKVNYNVHPGPVHRIRTLTCDISDPTIDSLLKAEENSLIIQPGDALDRNVLDAQRSAIAERLRNAGYFGFSKEYIGFIADTAFQSLDVDLTLVVRNPSGNGPSDLNSNDRRHEKYLINRVIFVTDASMPTAPDITFKGESDTVAYKGITVIYGSPDHYIRPSILEEKCYLRRDRPYSSRAVDRTYEALAQLGILKSVNIELVPVARVDDVERLDAYVFLTRNKKQSVSFELEGTNSEGDFGFGLGLNYQHRNVGRRSNQLNAKLRVNYESLSGNLSDLINDRYTEYAGEVGLTFPKFLMPFVSRRFKLRSKASTELSASFNYQQRPEYTRIIAGAAWKYKWQTRDGRRRTIFDLLDINYVYLPETTIDFINQIAPTNPLLRYSYEDHFIMRMGLSYYKTNRRIISTPGAKQSIRQPWVYTLRTSLETAGNLLYAISSLSGQKRTEGVYRIFGIQYSEYAKAEIDYAFTRNFNERHALAFHAGAGIGVPYGNSRVLPFEKRFYAGGANSVRGWGVRTLGPGCFDSHNNVTDFINQCGDIRLDLSAEYRAKLFWLLEGAAFIDAGNVWTIHNYENQPGGMFRLSTFWKQIAWSYGVGLRLDFNYFLLRLDMGVKAYNPAMNQDHWPLIHPRWKRDVAFHFSVGYPF